MNYLQDEDSTSYDIEIDLDELLDIEGDFNRKAWLGVSLFLFFSLKVNFSKPNDFLN